MMPAVGYGGGDNSGYGGGGGGLTSDPRDPGGYNLPLVGGGALNMRKGEPLLVFLRDIHRFTHDPLPTQGIF
jgi:hypothetical protein